MKKKRKTRRKSKERVRKKFTPKKEKKEIKKKILGKEIQKTKKHAVLTQTKRKQIDTSYSELKKSFVKIHYAASQEKDKEALKKLDEYKDKISDAVNKHHKDPSNVKTLTNRISQGMKLFKQINRDLEAKRLKKIEPKKKEHEIEKEKAKEKKGQEEEKEKEDKKSKPKEKQVKEEKKEEDKKSKPKEKKEKGELLKDYVIEVDGAKAKVKIIKERDGILYNLDIPKINIATTILLNDIRNDLIAVTTISMKELVDPKAFSFLKERFMRDATKLIRKKLPNIKKGVEEFLVGHLMQEMLGLGKIEFLINDPNLEEIVIVSSKEPIRIYSKEYGWLSTNITVEREEDIVNYSNIIARRIGRQITILSPLLDAHLVTGDRINAVLYPINTKGNTITIRKFARDPFTIIDLIENKTCDLDTVALIWLAVEYEMNVLISGGTASGKTVFLNACMPFIPPNHRIISIEDTRELMLPEFLYWTPLVTRIPNPEGKGGVSMLDLLINSLRMRPDRIILGEMRRHEEGIVLFEAMHTGHSVYATVHADSAAETISRLINPPLSIPPNLLKAINLNVVMYRDRRKGIRRITHIAEVEATGDSAKANILYRWSPEEDKIVKHSESSRFFEDVSRHTGMSNADINRDLTEKKKILSWLLKHKIRSLQNFGKIMNFYYRNKDFLLKAINKNDPKLILES